MATEIGNIHIGLYVDVGESRRFTDVANIVERSSARMNSALGNTSHAVRALRGQMSQTMQFRIAQNSLRDLTRATDATTQLRTAIVGLSSLATGSLVGSFGIAGLVQMADKARLLNNQIATVTDSTANFSAVQGSLFDVAQRTRSSYEATTVLYARMARATDHFNFSQEKLLRTTETIQKAFAIGGASTQEAQGAAIQLSQGIASDRFSGEEFRSVAENAPVLLRGIADALGVNIGRLREMAHAGELTAQVVTEAILTSSAAIDTAFTKMTPTVAQAWTLVTNAIIRYTGESDQAYGLTENMAKALAGLAANFEDVMFWVSRATAALVAFYAARKLTLGVQNASGNVRANNAGARDVVAGLRDENQAISNRILSIDKERATVSAKVASANAAVVSSLQRQVEEGRKIVRDNALRVIQTNEGTKAHLTAVSRYEKSVAVLETRMQRLSSAMVNPQIIDAQKKINDLNAERVALIDRQVLNTNRLAAAQKRMTALGRGWQNFLGFFGGGVGLGITAALTVAGVAMAKFAADAQRSAQETENITKQLRDMGYLTEEAASAMDEFANSIAGREVSKLQSELQNFQKDLDKTVESLKDFDLTSSGLNDKISFPEFQATEEDGWFARTQYDIDREAAATKVGEAIAKLRDEMINARGMSNELRQSLEDVALANPELSSIILSMLKMGERMNALKKATDDWRESITKIRSEANKLPQERYWNSRTEAAENQRKIAQAQGLVVTTLIDEANLNDSEKRIRAIMDKIVKDMEKAGAVINTAAVRADAERIYSAEVTSGAVGSFVDRVVKAEYGSGKVYKNPNSSASGPGQFIESTWLGLFKKYIPERSAQMLEKYGKDAVDAQILALRANSDDSRALIEAYARENASTLQKAGVSVDEVALQLAHFLGPQGAIAVLKAAPGTLAKDVLGASAVKANPTILGNGATVDDVIAYGQKRAGMSTSGTQKIDARENFGTALAEQQKALDNLIAEAGIRSQLNPLVNDYDRALTRLEVAQKLLNEAQEQGVAVGVELKDVQQLLAGNFANLTPEAQKQAEAILRAADSYSQWTVEMNKTAEAQEKLKEVSQEWTDTSKDIFKGFLNDLRAGKSATEALGNALDKLADKLMDAGIDALFSQNGLGGLFNNFFGGIFGGGGADPWAGLRLAGGGEVRGPGGPTDDKIPAMLSNGEHVTRAAMAKKYAPLLRAINEDRVSKLAAGGFARTMPTSTIPRDAGVFMAGMKVDVGVSFDKDGNLQAYVKKVARSEAENEVETNNKKRAPGIAIRSIREYQKRG